jgi:AcrR family transcriptional regulator
MPRASTRPRNSREDVREAALTLFAEHGYRATGIRDIADALGIGTTSVYSHISSKAELLAEVVFGTIEAVIASEEDALASTDDPAEQLRRLVESFVRHFTRHPREAIVTTRDFVWLEGEERRRALALRDEFRERIVALLARGHERGSFVIESPKVAAFAIIEMCEAIPTWFDPTGELSESRLAYLYAEFAVSIARAGTR